MLKRLTLLLAITLTVGVLLIVAGGVRAEQQQPPNVVMIISDDQAWTDYSFLGHPYIKTPHIDRLARQSARFDRGYVPTALCRPSLATMITGRYAHEHKISGNDPAIPAGPSRTARRDPAYMAQREKLISHIDRYPTLPKLLATRGYVSFQSGKWWEGSYARGGFTAGMTHGDPARGGRHGDAGLKIGRDGMQPVFDFIDQAQGKPFFVWYAPFLPHTPHNPPARLLEKHSAPDRPDALAKYYAMCEWFDETCGQLLMHLDRRDLADNTLVVYVTDNGWIQRTPQTAVPAGWRSSFAPRSKQSPYEGGVRTPILLRWPPRIRPRNYPQVVSSIDLFPTILAACGVEPPADLPGRNLLDLCDGKPLDREAIFGEGFAHDIADLEDPTKSLLYRWCIADRWKLLLTYDGKVGRYGAVHLRQQRGPQLFDLLADPHEERNLAAEHPQRVAELKQRIDAWYPVGGQ